MNNIFRKYLVFLIFILIISISLSCFSSQKKGDEPIPDRLSAIPEDAAKLVGWQLFF